jgi:hypothetical protein
VAISEGKRADEQENIKLASRLANEASSLYVQETDSQLLSVLLAAQAMQIYPVADAAEILQNQKIAQMPVRFTNQWC